MAGKLLVSLLLLLGSAFCSDIILISPPSGEDDPGFYINAKTRDQTVRAGESVQLTCGSSEDWNLCAFRTPRQDWCYRLSTSKYTTACEHDERVRYQVGTP